MRMQRTGLRAFAFSAAVIGIMGLALTLAGGPIAALGLILAGVCLLGLLAVAWMASEASRSGMGEVFDVNPDVEYAEPDMFPEQENETLIDPIPPVNRPAARAPPVPTGPNSPLVDMESPLQRALAGLPPKPAPPSRYSQRMPVIPAEEDEGDEPVTRARRLVPSGQTLGEKREAAKKAKKAPPVEEEVEFTAVPKPARATARPAVVPPIRSVQPATAQKVPLVIARKAGKGAAPADMARGKCSGCDTMLWATKTRPVNLRCPECGKVTLLK